MAHYIIDSRRCPDCTYRRDEYRHFKNCIPKRYWPPESEWRDFMPVPVKVPAMVGKYPRAVYEAAFPTVLSRPVEPVVDNQTVYLEPEPWPSPAETWGARLAGVTVPSEEATALAYLEARNDRGLPSEGAVRINPYPEIVIGPYDRSVPVGPACDVCGRIFKHLGALSGHMRSHKGGS